MKGYWSLWVYYEAIKSGEGPTLKASLKDRVVSKKAFAL